MEVDHLFKQLDKNDQWIQNVDTKISTILTFLGVFSGFIIAQKDIKQLFELRWELVDIFALVLFCLTSLMIIFGLWFAFSGIQATTKNKRSGLWFFGDVASIKSTPYFIRKKESQTKEELIEDILVQIHNTAKIANQKFKRFNQSLICTKWAVIFYILFSVTKLY